ncbi:MAG: class I SAM-dependent methyltransferase [Casimicrobiaceae bacterium]
MTIIPWRLKLFLSDRFPLLFHLIVNFGTRGNSQTHWDTRLAETWDSASRNWPSKNELIASLTFPSDAILDIACGNGGILRYLKSQGHQNLHGLEISEYAIRRLRTQGIQMHHSVLPNIALPDASFDVLIASQVLEHIIRRRRLLKEMRRVLKPGGRALIFVPDNCLGPIDEPEHVIKFDERKLKRLLECYFENVNVKSIRDTTFSMPILFAEAS